MKIAGLEIALRPLENLNLKLIALALALGLWSLVPDTTTPHTVRGVPIQLENMPASLALAEPFEATLDVRVVGTTVRAREIIPGELSPTIDLAEAHAGENTETITPGDIPTPLGVAVDSISPSQVVVWLETRTRASRPVNAVVQGEPAAGYSMTDKVTDPEMVTIVGPRSRVDAIDAVPTEVVSVAGERATVERTVSVLTNDPLVEIDGTDTVRLTITIEEEPVTLQLEELPVEVIGARGRVAVNPDRVGVVLEGPPSVMATIDASNVRIMLDVSGLAAIDADHKVAPSVRFEPGSLAERVEVLALTPQRRLDVRIFPR